MITAFVLSNEEETNKFYNKPDYNIFMREGNDGSYEIVDGFSAKEIADAMSHGFHFIAAKSASGELKEDEVSAITLGMDEEFVPVFANADILCKYPNKTECFLEAIKYNDNVSDFEIVTEFDYTKHIRFMFDLTSEFGSLFHQKPVEVAIHIPHWEFDGQLKKELHKAMTDYASIANQLVKKYKVDIPEEDVAEKLRTFMEDRFLDIFNEANAIVMENGLAMYAEIPEVTMRPFTEEEKELATIKFHYPETSHVISFNGLEYFSDYSKDVLYGLVKNGNRIATDYFKDKRENLSPFTQRTLNKLKAREKEFPMNRPDIDRL